MADSEFVSHAHAAMQLDDLTADEPGRASGLHLCGPHGFLRIGRFVVECLHVQSGKTANFTDVIGKAIDAGYRLVVVLTGTIDVLRKQTQRRIDMELVGKENILRGVDPNDPETAIHVDYQDDPDWAKFVEFGFLPSSVNCPDIIRLTGRDFDYKSLRAGIVALEFEKVDKTRPLIAPVNLPSSSARIVVVKNKAVLKKFASSRSRVGSFRRIRPRGQGVWALA